MRMNNGNGKLDAGNRRLMAALAITLVASGALAAALVPVIRTVGVTNNYGDHVTFVGEMVAANSTQAVAWVLYGQTDAATNAAAWGATNDLGLAANGMLTNTAYFLELGTNYWFRFAASNENGFAWATNSMDLQTPGVVLPPGAGVNRGPFYSWFADTNLNTDVTQFVPGHAGVYLFGNLAGLPVTWVSTGATAAEWEIQSGAFGQAEMFVIAINDTNTTTITTSHAAGFAGQWLFGKSGGTNTAWAARSIGSNDWMLIR